MDMARAISTFKMLRFLLVASLAMGSVSNSLGGIPLSVSVDDDGGVASVEFEASSKFYYILLFGETVTDFEPVALIDGSRAPGIFPAIDSTGDHRSGFFAVQSFSLSDPHDADLDGMDDLFESGWRFLNPFDPMDAELDQDGDGLTNFEEYLRRTDPSSRDTYSLESLSESFVVGHVSSMASVRAQVSDAGLGVDGTLTCARDDCSWRGSVFNDCQCRSKRLAPTRPACPARND